MEAIHFESFPYTSEMARDKVLRLAQIVSEYNNDDMIVHVVSLTKVQEELVKHCDEDYFTLLLRRTRSGMPHGRHWPSCSGGAGG